MTPQLFTVCVTAKAADATRARVLSLDWVKSFKPFSTETVEEMLPTPLSPTGAGPVTHFLCCLTLNQAACDHMREHQQRNDSPVVLALAGPQEDTLEAKLANRDRWLNSVGLKVVA